MIYYAVAWGMRNEGDEVDAGPALAALEHLLVSATRNSGSPALFIDQFNFFDNTPEFSHNTRLRESQRHDARRQRGAVREVPRRIRALERSRLRREHRVQPVVPGRPRRLGRARQV